MSAGYEPEGYWEQRLTSEFSLRGTGHADFSPGYNYWVYRQKARVLELALAGATTGGRALDIGSGVGWVVDQLLRRGLRVDGCDITDVAVERLRKQYPNLEFFKAGVGSAPIPRGPATYDVVTMLDVAYHITDDGVWADAVGDVARVLRSGGIFVITDSLGTSSRRVSDHVQFRSRAEWERAAAANHMRLTRLGSLYTWLSRRANIPFWRRVPDGLRGRVEYVRDARIRQPAPHLRWAAMTKVE